MTVFNCGNLLFYDNKGHNSSFTGEKVLDAA